METIIMGYNGVIEGLRCRRNPQGRGMVPRCGDPEPKESLGK